MNIAVIGNLNLDTISQVHTLPGVNEFAIVEETNHFFGGWSGNIAVVLQHLGVQTTLFAVGGVDFFDSGYKAYLSQRGVNIENVIVIPDEKCAHFTMFRDDNNNSYAFFHPNVEQKHYDNLLTEISDFSRYDIVCLAKFGSEDATSQLIQNILRSPEVTFAVAMGGDILYRGTVQILRQILGAARYIFMNHLDLQNISLRLCLDNPQMIFSLPYVRIEALIVTHAEKGSILYTRGGNKPVQIPAVPPILFVSTLGAGDAYVGGFLYGLTKQWEHRKCGEFAATVSSFILEGESAQTPLPPYEELKKRLAESFGYVI